MPYVSNSRWFDLFEKMTSDIKTTHDGKQDLYLEKLRNVFSFKPGINGPIPISPTSPLAGVKKKNSSAL